MKLSQAYKKAQECLKNQGADYISDARFLLTSFIDKDFSYMLLHPDEEIDFAEFEKLLKQRLDGVPVQYIAGFTEFMGLKFKVDENVLVPRQDTEILVETVISLKKESPDILDVCTGSGCIIISLLKYIKGSNGTAIDVSEKALDIANQNAKENGTDISFIRKDVLKLESFDKKYDVIVSNPPYIETNVIETLDEKVKNYEPKIALDGGGDGLLFYRKITGLAKNALNKDGYLLYEIGYNQGEKVKKIMSEKGFSDVLIIKDYQGNDRVVYGKAGF